jgi:hypothetical protein
MNKALQALALIVLGATAVSAQNEHAHATIPIGMVSGDRVPDVVAYRLYFTHLSQLPEKPQADQVKQVGLSAADAVILTNSLTEFGKKYLTLTESYNAEATVAESRGKFPDIAAYHAALAKLVDEAASKLFAALSPAGVGKFVGKIKSEKSSMSISESEARQ